MAFGFSAGGGFGAGSSVIPNDLSHGSVLVPDAELLFTATFHRHGPDLLLVGRDGHEHLIPGYFASEHHPALMAPNGAQLSADTVDLLAGSPTPGQYAQAQPTAPADPAGKIEKVVGDVTVMRNGVAIAVHVGDAVFKSDVVQTGPTSSCGISFPDGTALNLVANTRMALSDYSYEAGSTSNSALFTLVQGTFAFVAGNVAHTGGMNIATPVATMGIRGTTGSVHQLTDQEKALAVQANAGDVVFWFLLSHDFGVDTYGAYTLAYRGPQGQLIDFGNVNRIDDVWYVTGRGPGEQPDLSILPLTDLQRQDEDRLISDLFQFLHATQQTPPGSHGSGGDTHHEDELKHHQDFNNNGSNPQPINFQFGTQNIIIFINNQQNIFTTPPPAPPAPPAPTPSNPSTTFIWNGTGNWNLQLLDWNQQNAPDSHDDFVIIQSGTANFDGTLTIQNLTINPGAKLDVNGGSLTVTGAVDDGGIITVDPSTLIMNGPVTVESTGAIVSRGIGSTVEFTNDVFNFGTIAARLGGVVTLDDGTVVNEPAAGPHGSPGKFVARGAGSEIDLTHVTFDNFGKALATHHGAITFSTSSVTNETGAVMLSRHHGIITFDHTDVTNEAGAVIAAVGRGSQVDATNNLVDNFGVFLAANRGKVSLQTATIINEAGGLFLALDHGRIDTTGSFTNDSGALVLSAGRGSQIVLSNNQFDNAGAVAAALGGIVEFKGEMVTNEAATTLGDTTIAGGLMTARDGGEILFRGGGVENQSGAKIEAKDYGIVAFESTKSNPIGVTNDAGAKMVAKDHGVMTFADVGLFNDAGAKIVAKDYGIVTFIETKNSTAGIMNEGTIEARDHGIVAFIDVGAGKSGGVINDGGLIGAFGHGAKVELADSTIVGGTLETRDGGRFETILGRSTFLGVTLDGAVVQVDCGTSLKIENGATIDGTVVLEGRGVVRLDAASDRILAGADGGTLINKTTILGNGQIGDGDGQLKFINAGTVAALDPPGSNEFIIDTGVGTHGAATTINHGTLEADGKNAVLLIEDTTLDNRGGVIAAFNGKGTSSAHASQVDLDGVSITGGTLETTHHGTIDVVDGEFGATTFDNLTNDGRVVVEPGATLDLRGTIDNEGMIVVDGSAGADLRIDGTVTLDGGGVVKLEESADEIIGGSDGGGTLKNESTIEGDGRIGTGDDALTLINKNGGVVDARGGLLTVDTGDNAITNASRLEATHGGTLDIKSDVDNDHGSIVADGRDSTVKLLDVTVNGGDVDAFGHGANVDLDSATIRDATVQTRDGGLIQTVDGTSTFKDVTIARGSHVRVDDGTSLALKGTIDNQGTIDVDEIRSGASLIVDGTVTLDGSGVVKLDGWSDKIVGGGDGGGTLKNESTIEGDGRIGTGDDALTLINRKGGVVDARGGLLTVDTGDNAITNAGRLEATYGGTLDIKSDVDNDHGSIVADGRDSTVKLLDVTVNGGDVDAFGHGANVDLDNATIRDATLQTRDGGLIQTVDGTSTFKDVTIARGSHVRVDDGTSLALKGMIDNQGTIDVDEILSGASLIIDGAVTLDGGGVVKLDGWSDKIVGGGDGGGTLKNESTIEGDGRIGIGNDALTLINKTDGVVDAKDGLLVVDTGDNGITNAGLMEATCGGTLELKSDVENKGGTIGAFGVDSLVKLFGVTITGGMLATGDPYWRDDGVIEVLAAAGMTLFDGSQKHDPVKIAGFVQVDPGAALELKGDIELNGGAVELDQSGSGHHIVGSKLVIDGTVTLSGYGDIALEGNDTGIVGAFGSHATLVNDSSIYGSRGGFIGNGDVLTLDNHGTIDSEAGHAGPLVIDTGCNVVTNTGTLEATAGSELDLYGTYSNAGGTIAALTDGVAPAVVKLFDATIHGGTLSTDGCGSMIEVVRTDGANASVFDGSHDNPVTVDGYVQVDAGANLELIGTINIGSHGTINVDGEQPSTDLIIDGTVKLDGGGTVMLSGNNDSIVGLNNHHDDDDSGNTLINSDTISGFGNIGDHHGDLTLNNKGTIDADVHGQTLTVDTGSNAITNTGTLKAENGGFLDVKSDVHGGDAHIQSGGILEFDGKSDTTVTFGSKGYGDLRLGDWSQFSGEIKGFAGSEPDAQHSDEIQLLNFTGHDLHDTVRYDSDDNITTLTVSDSKNSVSLKFAGHYTTDQLTVEQDGKNVDIFDPPTSGSLTAATANGSSSTGAGSDNFVFHTDVVAGTPQNPITPQPDPSHATMAGTISSFAPTMPEIHPDFTLDAGLHVDTTTAMDQFHQTVAGVTLVH
jgi:FecR protein